MSGSRAAAQLGGTSLCCSSMRVEGVYASSLRWISICDCTPNCGGGTVCNAERAATLVSHRGVSCSKSLSSDVQSNQSLQHWQLSGSTPNNVPINTVPRFEPEYSI